MQIILQVIVKTSKKQNEEKEKKPYFKKFWCFLPKESEIKLKNLETGQFLYGARSVIRVLNLFPCNEIMVTLVLLKWNSAGHNNWTEPVAEVLLLPGQLAHYW